METEMTNKKVDMEVVINDKIKIINLNIKRIIIGLTEIGNLDIEDFDTNLSISKTIANLNVAEKAYVKTMQNLMKKHILKDDKGKFVVDGNNFVYLSVKDKEEYEKAIEALNETEVTEKIFYLKTSVLKNVSGLKGNMMAKCHEVINDDLSDKK